MLLFRPGTEQATTVAGITRFTGLGNGKGPETYPPATADGLCAGRSATLSQSTPIPTVYSRYEPLVLIPLTPSYYCPLGTPPPYCLLWLGTQVCSDAASW
jgi:hypothetical protein